MHDTHGAEFRSRGSAGQTVVSTIMSELRYVAVKHLLVKEQRCQRLDIVHIIPYNLRIPQYGFKKLFKRLLWAGCSSKLFRSRPPTNASSCRDSTKLEPVLLRWGQDTREDDVYAPVKQRQNHAWYVKTV